MNNFEENSTSQIINKPQKNKEVYDKVVKELNENY